MFTREDLLHFFFQFFFFFFNDTATTEIYTLSLHDALPIFVAPRHVERHLLFGERTLGAHEDRKSTRLNSSHSQISYAVFCLKQKKKSSIPGRRRGSGAPRRSERESTARY